MKTFFSLLEVTHKGARGACRHRYSARHCPYVYRLRIIVPFGRGLYICSPMKPYGSNLLDKFLKGFMIPADLPWKGVKRLVTSGEMVNHDL